jgi:retron-type reverse transcriptase
MALPHVGKKWVASIDLADFFPSITWEWFARKVTQNSKSVKDGAILDVNAIKDVCFHDFADGKGLRLPQGAPTSPFLSNAYLFGFDWLMAWKAAEYDCDYSRYADDLVISGEDKKSIIGLLKMAERVLSKDYGLKVNHRKTKVVHRTRRQMVCGVVVNEKLNTPRRLRKNLRAELHQARLKGGELSNETKGRVAFHDMVIKNTKTTYSSRDIICQIKMAQILRQSI